tara:strand:+ start:368 stop:517 length:150 start_codon:yes stop_codon:yes gene_type:complete
MEEFQSMALTHCDDDIDIDDLYDSIQVMQRTKTISILDAIGHWVSKGGL